MFAKSPITQDFYIPSVVVVVRLLSDKKSLVISVLSAQCIEYDRNVLEQTIADYTLSYNFREHCGQKIFY